MHDSTQLEQSLLALESQVLPYIRPEAADGDPQPLSKPQDPSTARSALLSLKRDIAVGKELSATDEERTADDPGYNLAQIPAGVPNLSAGMKPSQDLAELKALLINSGGDSSGEGGTMLEVSSQKSSKVGAVGMGGIGKTVLAALIARDLAVRAHFDLILWVTSSQTPNLSKLQQLLYLQATGTEAPVDKSEAELVELISMALRGKRALLILDDGE